MRRFLSVFHAVQVFTSEQVAEQAPGSLGPILVVFAVACCNGALLCPTGTNVLEAKRILTESGLPITSAENLDDAAIKAISAIKK